jgi:hypothetical protein
MIAVASRRPMQNSCANLTDDHNLSAPHLANAPQAGAMTASDHPRNAFSCAVVSPAVALQ